MSPIIIQLLQLAASVGIGFIKNAKVSAAVQAGLAGFNAVEQAIAEQARLQNIPPDRMTVQLMAEIETNLRTAADYAALSRERILAGK